MLSEIKEREGERNWETDSIIENALMVTKGEVDGNGWDRRWGLKRHLWWASGDVWYCWITILYTQNYYKYVNKLELK